ncbi:MAG: rhamnogalacturonan acetylesterase [Gemmata sp.]
MLAYVSRRGVLAAIALVAVPALSRAQKQKIRVAMVGDSTMASYPNPPKDRPDLHGWGQVFGAFFTDTVEILNHAASGRSTKSFVAEKRWAKVLDAKPDYVFIQFGHNDQKDKELAPDSGYRDYLIRYVEEAQKAGIKPVLVTPVARRTFDPEGKPTTSLAPFADATKKVATDKGVPVIDLHQLSFDLYGKLGDKGSADFSPAASDRTHFSKKGASAVAELVAKQLPTAVPELKPVLAKRG